MKKRRIQVNITLSAEEQARLARDARQQHRSIAAYMKLSALERSAARAYTLEIEPAEEGGYVVSCPALGCVTQGETLEDAIAMGQDCVQGWIEALQKLGKPIPTEPEPTRKMRAVVRVKTSVAA